MLRRVVALLALPMLAVLAQAPIQVTISSPTDAKYLVRIAGDSTHVRGIPIAVGGSASLNLSGTITILAVDSISPIHVEAIEAGRPITSATGAFVVVSRDSSGHAAMQARAHAPVESFQYSKRKGFFFGRSHRAP